VIKYFHNETSYKFLSAPIHLNEYQLGIMLMATTAHTKSITVLGETYSLHTNKTDNTEDKLLACLKLFTNWFGTLFNVNNPIS